MPPFIVSPEDVVVHGFERIVGLDRIKNKKMTVNNIKLFKAHYGPSPFAIAFVWNDIATNTDIDFGISENEKDLKGFQRFLIALHFIWAYPKNAVILATTVGYQSERSVQGDLIWKWVKAIGKLKAKVISWPEEEFSREDRRILLSVDGIDFKTYEKASEDRNVDKGTYSHKHNHGGLKYEIGVDAYNPKVVWIHGPF